MAYEELFVTESLDAIFTKEKIKLDIVLIMVCRCGRMEIEVNDARLTFTAGRYAWYAGRQMPSFA